MFLDKITESDNSHELNESDYFSIEDESDLGREIDFEQENLMEENENNLTLMEETVILNDENITDDLETQRISKRVKKKPKYLQDYETSFVAKGDPWN